MVAALLGLIVLLLIGSETGPIQLIIGMICATLPVPIYVMLLLWIDRYESEPLWMLTTTFLWGALVAVFIAIILNTVNGAIVTAVTNSAQIGEHFGAVISAPIVEESSAPADRYSLQDGTTFGIISSTTEPFCRSCDRSRLTADGMWYLCLYATKGVDLRAPLRAGASADDLASLMRAGWTARSDRGAEQRLELGERRAFVPVNSLKKDPHLEMHTRGG